MSIGGVEKELLALAAHIDKQVYEINIILTKKRGELLNDIPKYVKVLEVGSDSYYPSINHIYNLASMLKKIKPAITIGFMQDICFNILIAKILFGIKTKVIISEHIILSEWQRFVQTSNLKKILIRYLYPKADVFIAPSRKILDNLKSYLKIQTNNMYLLPNYIQQKVGEKSDEANELVKSKAKYFLFDGRLDKQKNITLLLKAFSLLLAQNAYCNIELVLIGSDATGEYKKLSKSLGIYNKTIFLGYVRNPHYYYKKAIGLVLPSEVEGMPRVLKQAMLSLCPIITSDFIGHDELITHLENGLVFKRGSTEQLLSSMKFFIDNKSQRKQMAKRAFDDISKTYTSKFETNFTESIKEILSCDKLS